MHRQDGEYKLKDICVWLNPYTFSNHPVLKLIRVYSCAFALRQALGLELAETVVPTAGLSLMNQKYC